MTEPKKINDVLTFECANELIEEFKKASCEQMDTFGYYKTYYGSNFKITISVEYADDEDGEDDEDDEDDE